MQPERLSRSLRPILLLILLGVGLVACKVTGEDIEYWKGTVKGPGKIVAVMLSDKYPMELRTQAALALVEMRRKDVDGVAELQRALQRLDEKPRQKIVQRMVPELKKMVKEEPEGYDDEDKRRGPPPKQVRAKDAAYLLITHAGKETRNKLIDTVVGWYVEDFNKRSLAGNYSAEQVVRSLGTPAANKLVGALNPHMPQQALVKIAELIGELGSEETKKKAAKRLVELEKKMDGEEFMKWLKDRIAKEYEKSDRDVSDKRLKATAIINREKFINKGALPAMKHLADQDVVADRLLAVASKKSTKKHMVERRINALKALEGNAKKKHLDQVMKLALNEDNPDGVRDYAFDRIGDIHSPKAIPKLWPIVEDPKKHRLRWRAGELVLALGGQDVVKKFFDKLPSEDGIEYAREELEGYAKRLSQKSPPPRDIVREQLESEDWWDRVIALRYFERKGKKSDVAAMKELTGDDTEVNGPHWKDDTTVGKVAKDAIKGLKDRISGPSKDDKDKDGDDESSGEGSESSGDEGEDKEGSGNE